LATAPADLTSLTESAQFAGSEPKKRRRDTSRLKQVPETLEMREGLRLRCRDVADKLDKSRPLSKDELEKIARLTLEQAGLGEGYLGWMMVNLASAFWHSQVASVPFERRLFLLPHCLKHAEGCPAEYDDFGLDCRKCGACTIADFRARAEDLGYKVLVAEGSPIVLKIIVSGYVDAICGVACLNVLEKAIDKILLAGIPCMAIPLLSSDCRNTSVDEQWVMDMIETRQEAPVAKTKSYVHLMRAAAQMFDQSELDRVAPRLRGGPTLAQANGQGVAGLDPIAATEAIAYDFLSKGGKHSRPFITLAVYDALTGGKATEANGAEFINQISAAIKRTAMSIETFHKASLVHDDIEDDDQYRYGDPTMHRKYGIPTAINVGDYLIGMGYRLVSRDKATLGADAVCDILDRLADAHMKLSEGQGAELLWRDSMQKQLAPLDALKIYALKTAPAFEAAVYSGLRLAGPVQDASFVGQFARHLGVAFQILNDLNDWRGDNNNKLLAGGDVLGGRPTVLWALALEGLGDAQRAELKDICAAKQLTPTTLARVKQLYTEAGVFDKAARLVEKYRQRAEEVADGIENEDLRRLFYYLIDTVLEKAEPEAEPNVVGIQGMQLPVVSR
jgi:geranylgeranyl pyrophosphate synthase